MAVAALVMVDAKGVDLGVPVRVGDAGLLVMGVLAADLDAHLGV